MKKLARTGTALLAALLLATSVPMTVSAAEDGSGTLSDIMNVSSNPAGFDKDDTSNPYGARGNQPFLMSEESELFIFRSADLNKDDGYSNFYIYDNLKYTEEDNKTEIPLEYSKNNDTFSSGFNEETSKGKYNDTTLSYMEAVSFDPTGSGRRDHIAVVGYDYEKANFVVLVLDKTGKQVAMYDKLPDCAFFGTDGNDTVGQHEATAFLTITAGNYSTSYNNDHIFIFAQSDSTTPTASIYELAVDEDYDITATQIGNNIGLNPEYFTKSIPNNKVGHDAAENLSYRLSADLTTGDFNGDGIEDLAAISYMNRPTDGDDRKNFVPRAYSPYLAVWYGDDAQNFANKQPDLTHYVCSVDAEKTKDDKDGRTYYKSMAGAGIDAGDVDGDGYDEIVIGGIYADVKTQKRSEKPDYSDNKGLELDSSKSRIAIFSANNDLSQNLAEVFLETDNNDWTYRSNGINENDDVWQQQVPVCVAIDGSVGREYIFYNGSMFYYNDSSELENKYTMEAFTKEPGEGRDQTFIQSAVAANFDGNTLGREQIVFIAASKEEGENSHDHDNEIGVIAGAAYQIDGEDEDQEAGKFGIATAFASNDPGEGDNVTDNKGGRNQQKLNCFVAALDYDTDGVTATYTGKELIYTDPQVLAVLQAAPYFGELGSWGDFQGATTYGFETSYTEGTTTGTETSWSVGVVTEIETPACKIGIEAGYVGSKNQEFTEEFTTTYGMSFTAGPEDTVVLYRVPLAVYNYTVIEGDETSPMSVSVPLGPTYYNLSISEYNAFVDSYNAYVEEKFEKSKFDSAQKKKIEDSKEGIKLAKLDLVFLGQEGNPWGYSNGDGGFIALGSEIAALSHNGSSITSNYSTESAATEALTMSHGFSVGLSVLVGANTPLGGVTAGVSTDMEQSFSTGSFTTNAKATSTEGTVAGIDAKSMSANSGIPQTVYNGYGFNWMFGLWNVSLTNDESVKTPVYGYKLSDITAPPATVEIEGVRSDDGETVTLTWDKPDSNRAADDYNVYEVSVEHLPATFTKLNVSISEDNGKYTCVINNRDPEQNYIFAVAGVDNAGNIGVYSNTYATDGSTGNIYDSLEYAIDSANKAKEEAAEAAEAAENAQKAAEEAQTKAEEAQTKAEAAQAAAEKAAKDAKDGTAANKAAAEKAQEEAENARDQALLAQGNAEAAQAAAEAAKDTAETAKTAAETAQAAAEAAQAAAETAADAAADSNSDAAAEAAKAVEEAAKAAANAANAAAQANEATKQASDAADAAAFAATKANEATGAAKDAADAALKAQEAQQKAEENANATAEDRRAAEEAREEAEAAGIASAMAAWSSADAAKAADAATEAYKLAIAEANRATAAADTAELLLAKINALHALDMYLITENLPELNESMALAYRVSDARQAINDAASITAVHSVLTQAKADLVALFRFTDIADSPYLTDILYVTEVGLMNGTGENLFSPEDKLNRATVVTVLWRLEGSPIVNLTETFSDLPENAWYTNAMKWAIREEIILGYGDNTCQPLLDVTYEQACAIFNRYMHGKGYDTNVPAGITTLVSYSDWASEAVLWAVYHNIPTSVQVSDMTGTANRGEIAVYLKALCEMLGK